MAAWLTDGRFRGSEALRELARVSVSDVAPPSSLSN
jgi:hypothetical protein